MSSPAAVPDYETLATLLADAEAEISAAEAHGILTGVLCAPAAAGRDAGQVAAASASIDGPAADEIVGELRALTEQTERQLHDPDFGFEPLLPAEGADLGQSTEALADWCRGFVYGLLAAGVKDFRRLPDDVREFLDDVMKMCDAEVSVGAPSEEDARALAELTEYLRAGVQLVYEELHGPQH